MKNAVIVSKTLMKNAFCIGAITLPDLQSIRLLDENGHNQPIGTPFEIGHVWKLNYTPINTIKHPHTEDVIVLSSKYIGTHNEPLSSIAQHEANKSRFWRGHPLQIFNGMLGWTNNRNGYISNKKGVPSISVGFWVPDKDLVYNDKHYTYTDIFKYNLAYVGALEPLAIIPSNTVVRVSLARWWKPDDIDMETRCYLQLSGWYN